MDKNFCKNCGAENDYDSLNCINCGAELKEDEDMSPYMYFTKLKEKVNKMDDKTLNILYNNALYLVEKYKKTGQKKAIKKLVFHIESIIKEKKVVDLGINKFIYKDDIEEYIEQVASNQVVIKDLKSYERDIPDEIVEALEKVKPYFDEFYIVYTDYTGKESRQVQKERREKDPILFGVFMDRNKSVQNERFYYIGDWIDEYCDLTLDKMVAEMKDELNKDIVNKIQIPESKEDLKEQLNNLKIEEDDSGDVIKLTSITTLNSKERKKGFFNKIKTFLNKEND